MESKKRENTFLIVWVSCLLLMVGACNLGFIRGTRSAFGNLTGQISVPCTINYISNYPDGLGIEDNEYSENIKCGVTYTILDSTFTATGYQFTNWNETVDGTGKVYNVGDSITVDNNMIFYGQWSLAPEDTEKDEEEVVVSYGDVNQNGIIDNDDYLLLEYHVSGVSKLTNQSLLNADVNADGNIDLVDADIIKQAVLGTDGYVNTLPSNPILIYEIYKGDSSTDSDEEVDTGTDDKDEFVDGNGNSQGGTGDNNSSSDDSNTGGSSSSGNTGSGNGSSGSGNSSSGSGTNGNGSSNSGSSSGSGNKPNSGNDSSNNNSSSLEENDADLDTDNKDDSSDEDNVSIETEEDDKDKEPIDKDKSKEENEKKSVSYVGIIVFIICLLALRAIIHVVFKFRQKEKNDGEIE